MDVKQLLKTTIGKIRMLFAEEEIFYIGGSDVLPPPCLLYTSPSPRDDTLSRMPSSA